MTDWGPVFVSVMLFIVLSPGVIFQLPGRSRVVEFINFQTSGVSILVHSILYFAFIAIFLLAIKVHITCLFSTEMADWGPVVIAVVLFVLLSPGLLFQLPGNSRVVEFANFQTSGVSICVHTVIFFGLITIFLIAIGVHISTG
ncbi:uncharacterized protein LOC109824793 [Asparagus officinalis]|uniref:uncharacterized protein LOC109824793 n=1 Tax=Asparagus officinalis TaxID=4686 RepID=UPI00098E3980|nr:uncharacterized protein LOC109824793 [Asparagus officinalis]